MNMLATIVPKSDQINADDLIGKTMTITINEVKFSGGQEQPVSMFFEGSDKAYRPCKSMCRVLVAAWGPDAKQYVGRTMTLYRDPTVKWGGLEVGGIRISHMSHLDNQLTMALTATKGSRKPFTVKPLANAPQKPAPIADEQDDKNAADLIVRINAAAAAGKLDAFLARPQVVEWRAFFATNRPDLSAKVEAVCGPAPVAEDDPFGGPAETDRGENHTATTTDESTAASLIASIGKEIATDGLDSFMARTRDQLEALPEDLQETVRAAYYARFEAMGGNAG